MWSQSKKEHIKSVDIFQIEHEVGCQVVACGDYIVAQYDFDTSIWSWGGQCTLSPAGNDHLLHSDHVGLANPVVVDGESLYFACLGSDHLGCNCIRAFDLATGDLARNFELPWLQTSGVWRLEMVLSGDMLLMLCGDMRPLELNQPAPEPGACAFDLRATSTNQLIEGELWPIVKASHNPNLFAALQHGSIDTLQLHDGQLACATMINLPSNLLTRTCPREHSNDAKLHAGVLTLAETQIFIHDDTLAMGIESVEACSTLAGQLLCRIKVPQVEREHPLQVVACSCIGE